MYYRCSKCKSKNVYILEFRTDYCHARNKIPLNIGIPELKDCEIDDYLDIPYCKKCRSVTEIEKCD